MLFDKTDPFPWSEQEKRWLCDATIRDFSFSIQYSNKLVLKLKKSKDGFKHSSIKINSRLGRENVTRGQWLEKLRVLFLEENDGFETYLLSLTILSPLNSERHTRTHTYWAPEQKMAFQGHMIQLTPFLGEEIWTPDEEMTCLRTHS